MTDSLFPVKPEIAAAAHVNADQYKRSVRRRRRRPHRVLGRANATASPGSRNPRKILSGDFTGDVRVTWFEDGTLNASVSCLDRHLATRGDQVAIIWESDDPTPAGARHLPRPARARLPPGQRAEDLGVQKGDRVCIYLPMVVEAAVAMLACARIGAVHTVVFGGFSPDSLAQRIQDAVGQGADHRRRGPPRRPQGAAQDSTPTPRVAQCPSIEHVLVVKVTGGDVPCNAGARQLLRGR